MTIPTSKEKLKQLIMQALEANYMSRSCMDGIKTGNHYQSVRLGDSQTSGFRTDRHSFLDQVDFVGKRVLDLGSNLGEISRASRHRGASMVDGFEYDQYFIEVANLVNAYNDTTRVSYFQRDITDPTVYREPYDIVIAFSVFSYVRSVLDEIANITELAFILETHKVGDNFVSDYLTPVSKHFPYYKVLGESEWARLDELNGKRVVVVFTKDKSTLDKILVTSPALESAPTSRFIDIQRTNLQSRFFETFDFGSTEQLFAAVSGMEIDVDALAHSRDAQVNVYGGWAYWLIFLKGYLQYANSGVVEVDNVHYQYLVNYFGPRKNDPGLSEMLKSPRQTSERVAQRFRDLDLFRRHASGETGSLLKVVPVTVVPKKQSAHPRLVVYDTEMSDPIHVRLLDGHHRLFGARLCGLDKFPYTLVADSEVRHDITSIDDFVVDGQRLTLREERTKGFIDRANGIRITHPQATPMVVSGAQPVRVEGWAVDGASVAGGVFLVVDDVLHIWAAYGWERPDVAEYLGEACRLSGYAAEIPGGTLSHGAHNLTLRVVTKDLSGYYLPGPQMQASILVD